ncbi:MAG: SGNH/GDSL hydrolase family protein [Methylacidiphilales bacterium]|nr:SGNH/GDSL hydrolase family protein [Candidatus Methylacidiphilales bacterium]
MLIHPTDTILFTGDSITDCGRIREEAGHLGSGYPAFIAARLQAKLAAPKLRIFNRGISGDRSKDLLARVNPDLLALKPTVLSILIGINDVWRRYDSNDPTSLEAFEKNYRTLLEKVREALDVRVILLEPFVLHVPKDRHAWREDLNPKIDAVRRLSLEFGTEYLPLDGLLAQAAAKAGPAFWAADGVHPTAAGHALIAQAWLENAGLA